MRPKAEVGMSENKEETTPIIMRGKDKVKLAKLANSLFLREVSAALKRAEGIQNG